MLAVGRASSELEHDTRLSPLPELPSPMSPPQAFTRDTLLDSQNGSAAEVPRSPFILQESENDGLVLRLSPRSADISARLPAGFCEFPSRCSGAAEPQPVRIEEH